jgi:hypothetical protein
MTKLPQHDWDFSDEAHLEFNDWFNGEYGSFSFRSEYFYGDCEIKDEKTLKDLMFKWIEASFLSGYERGLYNALEQQQNQLGGTE